MRLTATTAPLRSRLSSPHQALTASYGAARSDSRSQPRILSHRAYGVRGKTESAFAALRRPGFRKCNQIYCVWRVALAQSNGCTGPLRELRGAGVERKAQLKPGRATGRTGTSGSPGEGRRRVAPNPPNVGVALPGCNQFVWHSMGKFCVIRRRNFLVADDARKRKVPQDAFDCDLFHRGSGTGDSMAFLIF